MPATIDRRSILLSGLAASAAMSLPRIACAEAGFAPRPGAWRKFEVTTLLEISRAAGDTEAWIPVPSVNEQDWFRSIDSTWTTNASKASLVRDPRYATEMLHVEWANGTPAPIVEVTSRIATRDRATDFSAPSKIAPLAPKARKLYTQATALIPIDGIVKATSDKVTAGASTDIEKARAIYEWIVDNAYRNAKVRGCGIGDIVAMLESGDLGGKCADLNALYVGLARAAGLPARDVYGLRVASSKFGYKSLGANSDLVTKAQHCRAEVYLNDFGWIAVDPADVLKVALEEPPANLPLSDPKVAAARKTLFGSWEANWLAYNFGHDIALPGSSGARLGFLMYPQAETAALRLDCLDPEAFKYTIRSKEITAI